MLSVLYYKDILTDISEFSAKVAQGPWLVVIYTVYKMQKWQHCIVLSHLHKQLSLLAWSCFNRTTLHFGHDPAETSFLSHCSK